MQCRPGFSNLSEVVTDVTAPMSPLHRALLLVCCAALAACAPREPAPRPPEPPPIATPPAPEPEPVDELLVVTSPEEPIKLDWRARTAIAVAELQEREPKLYARLLALRPNRRVGAEMYFGQPEVADPRAAPVLLKRLLNGDDPVSVRLAVVDALPATGGDWEEGAAALVAVDASPRVRKKLVEVLRYIAPPNNLRGLRLAMQDEDLAVRVAATRTAGFTRDGVGLYTELVSASFDEDWDMRSAAAQALGQLRVRAARDRLVRMLADEHPEVRLQVLLALERVDPEGLRSLPELERLARDRENARLAALARRLLKERPPASGAASGGGGTMTAAP